MSRTPLSTTTSWRTPASDTRYTRISDVTYSGTQKVDIWKPDVANRPSLILLHGGAWTTQAKDTYPYYPRLATRFAELGFAVFNANYRYAPPNSAQDTIDDTLSLVSWVRANATTYNADATKVVGVGLSAGAHLLLMAGITGVAGATRPDAIAPWSAAIDFFNSASRVSSIITLYTGATGMSDITTIAAYSPLSRLAAVGTCCPMRIIGSSSEETTGGVKAVNFTDLYAQAVALGIPAYVKVYEGDRHAFFDGQDGPDMSGVGTSRDSNSSACPNDIAGTTQWFYDTLGWSSSPSMRTAASNRTASSSRVAA
jgi:acetyl esterase/lipase